jgi:acyl-CoA thioesterase
MYTDEWKKIKTKVPGTLWGKVEGLGFDSPNTAVITALENLISDPELKNSVKEQKIKIQELGNRLEEERKRTQELQRELEIRMEETQNQIKDLKKDIEKAERRERYLEEIHNNYMLQVQTLIKQK